VQFLLPSFTCYFKMEKKFGRKGHRPGCNCGACRVARREISHAELSERAKKAWTAERRKKQGERLRGKKRPEISGENHPFYGKKRPEHASKLRGRKRPEHSIRMKGERNPAKRLEVRMKISKALAGVKKSKEHCRKNSEAKKKYYREHPEAVKNFLKLRNEVWNTQKNVIVEKILKAASKRPNKAEQRLNSILQSLLSGEYKYVGDGEFILGGKCPDFININGKKKIIELFGEFWHEKDKRDNGQNRVDFFKEYGYDTLIIWEGELQNEPALKNKIIEFHNGD